MTSTSPQAQFQPAVFSCYAPEAEAVFLAGTFNEWNPAATPLEKDDQGNWSVSLELALGFYEYKFIVDGRWCCFPDRDDQSQAAPDCVPNAHGTMNRVIVVE